MMPYSRQTKHSQRGLSLVELMISITLGLVLIAGVLSVFLGSKKSADFNTALSGLQESARFAMNSIVSDARMAGHQGCIDINSSSAIIRADAAPTDNFFDSAVSASEVTSANSWTPDAPLGFTIPTGNGAPVIGTHAISLQYGSPETFTIQPMGTVADPLVLDNADSGLTVGDLAIVSNCQVADLFEITGAAGSSLLHAAAKNRGDNRLSAPFGAAGAVNRARVMRFEANIYYVGDTGRTDSNGAAVTALYRQTLPYSNPPIEMVEGVSNLKVKLGFRDPDAGPDLTFVEPQDSAGIPGHVEAVQIGFLMQSFDEVAQDDDTRTYFLAGEKLEATNGTPNLATQYKTDRRLRLAYNNTVSIRNRR
ncbi:MAG: PilW family protein [Gammaproteobacteria bacterium]|nr:PilW family protein [Gammaproteobacteria bacterium]